jgi:hypothetical protein
MLVLSPGGFRLYNSMLCAWKRAWRGGGGCARTVEMPRLTVPTNLRMEIVRAAMVFTLQCAAVALIVAELESLGVETS